ncbi:MAG TPA: hypothetical protein VHH88_11370, partial [Verrucomicrobiae bacterium]|nr:hypothetical protein [Verrucomicrobiae bacterium]
MSNDKSKSPAATPAGSSPATSSGGANRPPAKGKPAKVAPLFRRIDWIAFLITFIAVGVGYYLTLAPELTLEDSGELATGSVY